MNLSIKEKKQFNRLLELSLKIIPACLAIFLIGNILFNISYFSSLQFEWSSLLTLADYYEGSILYVAYAFLVFLLVSGLYLFQKKGMSAAKETILYLRKIIILIFSAIALLPLFISLGIVRITMIRRGKLTFHIKRKYIELLKDMKSAWKLVYRQFFLHIIGLICLVSLGAFLLILLFIIIYTLYLYNWLSLLIVLGIYINLLLLINRDPSLWKILAISVTVYWYTMWSLGGFTARPNPGYGFPFLNFIAQHQPTHISTTYQQDLILVRMINKGVIAKDNDDIYFIKWEDVKYLHKQKNAKQGKKNAI